MLDGWAALLTGVQRYCFKAEENELRSSLYGQKYVIIRPHREQPHMFTGRLDETLLSHHDLFVFLLRIP